MSRRFYLRHHDDAVRSIARSVDGIAELWSTELGAWVAASDVNAALFWMQSPDWYPVSESVALEAIEAGQNSVS